MRSILSDLRERLGEAREEQRELTEYIQSIERLIALEERRGARQRSSEDKPQPVSTRPSRKPVVQRDRRRSGGPSPVKDLLVRIMSDGRPWSLDELKEAADASAIDFEGKSAGKVIHFTLVALKNSDRAEYDKTSALWRLTEKGGADRQLFDVQSPSPSLGQG